MSEITNLAEAEEIVSGAAQDVLETMFFAMVDEEAEPPEQTPEMVCARVGFSGTWDGSLRICLPEEALRMISADFLGLEDEDDLSGEQRDAVMSELVNMICGSALSQLNHNGDFRLQAPRMFDSDAEPTAGTGLDISLPLEHGLLRLHLAIHDAGGE